MHSTRIGWLFLAPTIFILALIGVVPFVYIMVVSFHQWNPFGANPDIVFNGVTNFRRLVFDDRFLWSLWVTIKFAFFAVTSEIILGYFLAQMLSKEFPGKTFFRTIHTLPLIIAPIVIGAIWRFLLVPSIGIVPQLLNHWFGIEFNYGTYPSHAFISTVVMDIWHWTPLVTLTLMAGIASLPKEPFEQAQVDGASRFRIFWEITLPMIKPAILATVFIRLMDAFRTVEEIWMLAGEGPAQSTRYLGLLIWQVVFPKTNFGYGAAMSVLVLYFTLVASWVLYVALIAPRRSHEGDS